MLIAWSLAALSVLLIGAILIYMRFFIRGRATQSTVYSGRQQIRRAARQEAALQLAAAPVPRRIRRAAARDISHKVL